VVLLIDCKPANTSNKILRLKMFSGNMDQAKDLKVMSESNDGYGGKLLLNGTDTIYFNFGYSIDNLSEKDPAVVYYPYNENSIRDKLDTSLVDPREIIYTKKPNFDIDEFRRQNITYITVSGYRAKLTFPREIARGGTTGLYIDSLRKDNGGTLKFNFYARNLDSASNQAILTIIKSIEFNFRALSQ
jgi:hypothetical protein